MSVSSKEFLEIQATIEFIFTLKHVRDMIITCSTSNHEVSISYDEKAIYILQTIKVGQQQYSLFYNTGGCDKVSRYNAIKTIGDKVVQELLGPISIVGGGNAEVKTTHGIYKNLMVFNGNDTLFGGVCLGQITVQFPNYPLQGRVEKDVNDSYKQTGGDMKNCDAMQCNDEMTKR